MTLYKFFILTPGQKTIQGTTTVKSLEELKNWVAIERQWNKGLIQLTGGPHNTQIYFIHELKGERNDKMRKLCDMDILGTAVVTVQGPGKEAQAFIMGPTQGQGQDFTDTTAKKPRGAQSAFVFFMRDWKNEHPDKRNVPNVKTLCLQDWNLLPTEIQEKYVEKEAKDKERYKTETDTLLLNNVEPKHPRKAVHLYTAAMKQEENLGAPAWKTMSEDEKKPWRAKQEEDQKRYDEELKEYTARQEKRQKSTNAESFTPVPIRKRPSRDEPEKESSNGHKKKKRSASPSPSPCRHEEPSVAPLPYEEEESSSDDD